MSPTSGGWYGTDFDGTLAMHPDPERPWPACGRPIPKHVDRIKRLLAEGKEVRIVTARVSGPTRAMHRQLLDEWCQENLGTVLEVTNQKDFGMLVLYDDRCVQIIPNTGERADGEDD
jgi:hypothetical protein